jgi:photosystem II stability/assembly factor-like uncharacterized protein
LAAEGDQRLAFRSIFLQVNLMFKFLAFVAALLLAAPVHAAFSDPLTQPAAASTLAARSPINGLAYAGARIVAVGQRGHIVLSDDGGNSWQQARVPLSVDLAGVFFATQSVGWAIGHDGVILRTVDSGANWTRQRDGRRDGKVDERPLLDLWFDTPQTGIAVGAFGLALCTADGGIHWNDCQQQFDNPQGMHMNAIRAIGGAVYVAGEQGLLLRREAGAARFTPVVLPYRGSLFGMIGDAQQLIVFGLRGNAWRSADLGASWQQLDTGLRSGIAAGVRNQDGSFMLLAQSGRLLASADGSRFAVVAEAGLGPVTAALPGNGPFLLLGGVRGVRRQPMPLR